jgi:hypothetical protein
MDTLNSFNSSLRLDWNDDLPGQTGRNKRAREGAFGFSMGAPL